MRRTVVCYPEHSVSRPIGFLIHDEINQPSESINAGFCLTKAKNLCPSNIPSGKVCQSATALVLKLNTPDMIRGGSCGKAFSVSCLDTRFLISTDYKIIWSKPFLVPYTLIEVQHIRRLFRKIRITRKYPAAILPGFD